MSTGSGFTGDGSVPTPNPSESQVNAHSVQFYEQDSFPPRLTHKIDRHNPHGRRCGHRRRHARRIARLLPNA